MIMPGMQKPHWTAAPSMSSCWNSEGFSCVPTLSMVRTLRFSACMAKSRQA